MSQMNENLGNGRGMNEAELQAFNNQRTKQCLKLLADAMRTQDAGYWTDSGKIYQRALTLALDIDFSGREMVACLIAEHCARHDWYAPAIAYYELAIGLLDKSTSEALSHRRLQLRCFRGLAFVYERIYEWKKQAKALRDGYHFAENLYLGKADELEKLVDYLTDTIQIFHKLGDPFEAAGFEAVLDRVRKEALEKQAIKNAKSA